ncbi:hypothetical protein QJS66_17415 [Kocuria rhizophila]|nr:hypothetical protein QJS66_17415 [Kocuria rhizophila]
MVSRTQVADGVLAFDLEPADGTPMTPAVAGEQRAVQVTVPDGLRQLPVHAGSRSQPGHRPAVRARRTRRGQVTPALHRTSPWGRAGGLHLTGRGPGPDSARRWCWSRRASAAPRAGLPGSRARTRVGGVALGRGPASRRRGRAGSRSGRRLQLPERAGLASHREARLRRMDVTQVEIPTGAQASTWPAPVHAVRAVPGDRLGVPGRAVHYEIFGPDLRTRHDEDALPPYCSAFDDAARPSGLRGVVVPAAGGGGVRAPAWRTTPRHGVRTASMAVVSGPPR